MPRPANLGNFSSGQEFGVEVIVAGSARRPGGRSRPGSPQEGRQAGCEGTAVGGSKGRTVRDRETEGVFDAVLVDVVLCLSDHPQGVLFGFSSLVSPHG